MSDLGETVAKALIGGALGIAADIANDVIKSRREAAQRAVALAAATGVDALDLVVDLQDACAAFAEQAVRAGQRGSYGRSEGDDG